MKNSNALWQLAEYGVKGLALYKGLNQAIERFYFLIVDFAVYA